MKKLDKLIPLALDSAEGHLATNGEIPKEYKGYIASFGAMVRSGLRPAIAFYESKSADAAQDRSKLTRAILDVVTKYRNDKSEYDSLMNYVLNSNSSTVKKDILDAATALKLAIRTFKLKEG